LSYINQTSNIIYNLKNKQIQYGELYVCYNIQSVRMDFKSNTEKREYFYFSGP